MKSALAHIAFVAAILSAAPAQAMLSAGDAARLAELAFRANCPLGHSAMDASTATRRSGSRFFWFQTNFFLSETIDGSASFAVDRRTGAVWSVDDEECRAVDSPELAVLRDTLHLKHRASLPPSARYCHL